MRHGDGRIQLMAMAGEIAQLRQRLCAARGLVEETLAERQRLVGADHMASGTMGRDGLGFFARQQQANFARV